MKKIRVYWRYFSENNIPELSSDKKIPICIDKEQTVEALLRLTLHRKGVVLSEDMKIHCWLLEDTDFKHYFFINDIQNTILKDGSQSACSAL